MGTTEEILHVNMSVDVIGKNGRYDVYMAAESDSGCHYKDVSAQQIGNLLAEDIDMREEAEFGKSYWRDRPAAAPKLTKDDLAELRGQLVDGVQDFLEQRGYSGIIKDRDYDELAGYFQKTLENWKLIEACPTAADAQKMASIGDKVRIQHQKENFYPAYMWGGAGFVVTDSDCYGIYVDGYEEQIPHDDYEVIG